MLDVLPWSIPYGMDFPLLSAPPYSLLDVPHFSPASNPTISYQVIRAGSIYDELMLREFFYGPCVPIVLYIRIFQPESPFL